MPDADYSDWLTKQGAAAAIGCSTKTVEQLAKDGRLQQAAWRRGGRGPAVAVYHPADVARVAAERHPGASAFVLPAAGDHRDGNGNGPGLSEPPAAGLELASTMSGAEDVLRGMLAAALRAFVSEKEGTSEKSEKLFLSLAEASASSGLSVRFLRRLIKDGKLEAVRDRAWKIRRRDLEGL